MLEVLPLMLQVSWLSLVWPRLVDPGILDAARRKPSSCRSVPDKGREAEAQALLTSKFAALNKRSAALQKV